MASGSICSRLEESKCHSYPEEDMVNYKPATLISANPGNNFQAPEGQEGGQEKSAETYRGEMVLNWPDTILQGRAGQSKVLYQPGSCHLFAYLELCVQCLDQPVVDPKGWNLRNWDCWGAACKGLGFLSPPVNVNGSEGISSLLCLPNTLFLGLGHGCCSALCSGSSNNSPWEVGQCLRCFQPGGFQETTLIGLF